MCVVSSHVLPKLVNVINGVAVHPMPTSGPINKYIIEVCKYELIIETLITHIHI